jgi:hypothetical protein
MNDVNENNIAYSNEYLERQNSMDFVFETEPKQVKSFILGDDEYFVDNFIYSLTKKGEDDTDTHYSTRRLIIKDKINEIILETKSIDDHLLIELIKHRNGKNYILFNTDLYGYSIFCINENKTQHFIPEEVLMNKETFIWTDAKYCKINDVLMVNGCYWACPWGVAFYDFSDPMNIPLPHYSNSYDDDFLPDGDVEGVGFTEEGNCILKIYDNVTEEKNEIIFNVMEYINKKKYIVNVDNNEHLSNVVMVLEKNVPIPRKKK